MKLFYAGSFDPFTVAHADIVERAIKLGNEVVIGVGRNPAKKLSYLYSQNQRYDAIKEYYKNNPSVTVIMYEGMTGERAKILCCDALLRGVRSVKDFEEETQLAEVNRTLYNLDTVILPSSPEFKHISSTLARQVKVMKGDISKLVIPPFIYVIPYVIK